jgi:hypothetical protein
MRIGGTKPDPTNLADIVSSMDGESEAEAAGFGDDVITGAVGLPPEITSVGAAVITSPLKQKTEKARKKKEAPPAVEPTPEVPPEVPPPIPPDDQMEFEQEDAAQVAQGKTKPVIEHNIPIPAHGNVGAVRYPFREMKQGDSFFVRQETGESRKKLSARVRSASAQFRRRSTGELVTFTTRMEKNGIRVWRLT